MSVLKPRPRDASPDPFQGASTDAEFSRSGDLRSVRRVVSTPDFADVVVGETRSVRAAIPVAIVQVLPVVAAVQVPEIHTPRLSISTGVENKGFAGISPVKDPHGAGRVEGLSFDVDRAAAPVWNQAFLRNLCRKLAEVIKPVSTHGAKATMPNFSIDVTVPASPTP